jgi:TolB-like protein
MSDPVAPAEAATASPPSAWQRLRARLHRFRGLVVGIAAVGAVLSGFAGYWNTWRTVRGEVAPAQAAVPAGTGRVVPFSAGDRRMTFAVLPFEAPGGDADAQRLARTAAETVQTFQERRYLWARVVPAAQVRAVLPQHAAPEALGGALGVHFLLRGAVLRKNGRLSIDVTVTEAASGRVLDSRSIEPRPDEELEAAGLDDALGSLTYVALKQEVARAKAKPESELDVRDLTWRAYARDDAGNPAEAYAAKKNDLDRALALAPDDLTALYVSAQTHLCECLRSWARDLDAMERVGIVALDRFLSLRPDHARAHQLRAHVLLKHRRYEEALTVIEEQMRLDPSAVEALGLRTYVLMRLGRTDAMLASLARLQQANRSDLFGATIAAARFAAGDDAAAADHARRALVKLNQAQRGDAAYGAVALTLVAAEARRGRAEAAAAALRDLQALVPSLRTLSDARAWLLPNSIVPDDAAFFDALRRAGLPG